jgi:hypothetical protein
MTASGCSSSSKPKATANAGPGTLNVTFQMDSVVKPGEEMFKCQLVKLPSSLGAQAYMTSMSHDYTPGSHHLLLYTTDYTSIPTGADQVHDCSSSGAADAFSHVRGVMYGAQTPTGSLNLPAGVGMPAAPDQVLLYNVHYINSGPVDLDAHVTARLTFTNDGASITQKAGNIFWYDPFIRVPAGAEAHAQMRCPIPNDITLLEGASHYHKRGFAYGAYVDTAPDKPAGTPFYTSSNWEDPGAFNQPVTVAGGSAIRFQCSYDNKAGATDFFQGQSAITNEMCMFVSLYYPDQGANFDFCTQGADMFGSGSATCVGTLTCMGKCPAATISATSVDYSPCTQQCIVDSCPTATAKLVPLLTCIQKNCATECGGSSGDAGAPTDAAVSSEGGAATDGGTDPCTACVTASCPLEGLACSQHTCN